MEPSLVVAILFKVMNNKYGILRTAELELLYMRCGSLPYLTNRFREYLQRKRLMWLGLGLPLREKKSVYLGRFEI